MDWGGVFQQVVNLTVSFNAGLILAIFLLTLISEFGFSFPYLIESIWLLIGYNISQGMITPEFVVLFCLTSMAGRQVGAFSLYKISGFGSTPLSRLYNKLISAGSNERKTKTRLRKYFLAPVANMVEKNFTPCPLKEGNGRGLQSAGNVKARHLSSFNVALGRFIWLKIPITITMGMTRQLIALLTGVALFSLAWDGLYILIGIFGNGRGLSPFNMLLYSFGGFVAINLTIIIMKRKFGSHQPELYPLQ